MKKVSFQSDAIKQKRFKFSLFSHFLPPPLSFSLPPPSLPHSPPLSLPHSLSPSLPPSLPHSLHLQTVDPRFDEEEQKVLSLENLLKNFARDIQAWLDELQVRGKEGGGKEGGRGEERREGGR